MARTDHRTRVTKILLRRAFTDLLRQKPIQSISVKELCEAAGINRGTFYAHYTDVYDLRRQMEEEMLADFQEALEPLLSGDGGDPTPLKITAGIFQCLKDNADVCAMTVGPHGDKEFATRLINLGREKYVEGYRRYFASATPGQLDCYYAFVCGGCISLLEKWLADGMNPGAEEMAGVGEGSMVQGIGCLRRGP